MTIAPCHYFNTEIEKARMPNTATRYFLEYGLNDIRPS